MIPILAAAAIPIVKDLMEKGLTTLAGAVANKGKEYVEEKLGVTLDTSSPENVLALKQLEFDREEELQRMALENRKLDIQLEQLSQDAVTKRWEADLHSDNQLSKNIRPATLIYLLAATTLFTLLDSIPSLGFTVKPVWIEIWADAFQLTLGAYFLARTAEKGMNKYTAWKEAK